MKKIISAFLLSFVLQNTLDAGNPIWWNLLHFGIGTSMAVYAHNWPYNFGPLNVRFTENYIVVQNNRLYHSQGYGTLTNYSGYDIDHVSIWCGFFDYEGNLIYECIFGDSYIANYRTVSWNTGMISLTRQPAYGDIRVVSYEPVKNDPYQVIVSIIGISMIVYSLYSFCADAIYPHRKPDWWYRTVMGRNKLNVGCIITPKYVGLQFSRCI